MKDQKLWASKHQKAGRQIWLVTWICYRGRTRTASSNFSYSIKTGRRGEQISTTQTCYREGMGAESPAAGRFFCNFTEKMAILMRIGSHFARFQSHLKEQNF